MQDNNKKENIHKILLMFIVLSHLIVSDNVIPLLEYPCHYLPGSDCMIIVVCV